MMKNKYVIGLIMFFLAILLVVSCTADKQSFANLEAYAHEDGTYRGSFVDRGLIQVNLQFVLVDGVIREASYRHLQGIEPPYYMDNQEEPYKSVIRQYEEALQIWLVNLYLSTW